MSTATRQTSAELTVAGSAQQRVKAEIESMLQINGNTSIAQSWVPRVVMMAFERRCANNPTNGELAECLAVAQEIAGRS